MVKEKTTRSGTMAASKVARAFLVLLLEAEMSSREESSMMSKIAIRAPPTPMPMEVVMDMALLVADVVAALITVNIIFVKRIQVLNSYLPGFEIDTVRIRTRHTIKERRHIY